MDKVTVHRYEFKGYMVHPPFRSLWIGLNQQPVDGYSRPFDNRSGKNALLSNELRASIAKFLGESPTHS